MFLNLSQNSIIYVLDSKNNKLSTGTVTHVSIPRARNAVFGQNMDTVVDITAIVDGEKREFKQVPSFNTTANFGPDNFVLADSKESMNSYISTALQNSRNIVNSVDRHKELIKNYEELLQVLDPATRAVKEKDKVIQDLKDQMAELKEMLKSMANTETSKKE